MEPQWEKETIKMNQMESLELKRKMTTMKKKKVPDKLNSSLEMTGESL